MYADAIAHARISARSVRLDLPARDKPSASRVNTISSTSSSSASMMLAASWCRAREHVLPLSGEADVQGTGADQGQQPGRRADQDRAGSPVSRRRSGARS